MAAWTFAAWRMVTRGRAQDQHLVLDRDGGTIPLEPYAQNVIRVTLRLKGDKTLAGTGYGFVASPAAEGWSHVSNHDGDVYRSDALQRDGKTYDYEKGGGRCRICIGAMRRRN